MKIWIYRKRLVLLTVVLPILALSLIYSIVALEQNSLNEKIVIVDAGHGGIDSGANRPGALEKDINLAVALAVKKHLNAQGAKVVLTRDTDTELSDLCDDEAIRGRYRRDLNARLEMVEESDADLFVSIHANASSNPTRRGVECYYAEKSELGKKLAASIEAQLRTIAPISQNYKSADFFVLRRNKVPAVLIEVGFITNQEEVALLKSEEYQRKLAAAITKGIENYFQLN